MAVTFEGYGAHWWPSTDKKSGYLTILLDSGHSCTVPYEVGGELDAPPQHQTDRVRVTVEFTRETDPRWVGTAHTKEVG